MHLLWFVAFLAVSAWLRSISPQKLTTYAWNLYQKYSFNPTVAQARQKRKDLADLRAKRTATSAKDEFAKWAQIDRQFRKTKQEIDTLDAALAAQTRKVQKVVKILQWIATSGLSWTLKIYYRKVPIFELPRNVLPGFVEYLLRWPSAPKGSISIGAFMSITEYAFDSFIKSGKTAATLIKA